VYSAKSISKVGLSQAVYSAKSISKVIFKFLCKI
jgi:hypothetical protein